LVLLVSLGLGLIGCMGGDPILVSRHQGAAVALKAYCQEHQLQSAVVRDADLAFQTGRAALEKDDATTAARKFELAVLGYRLAIAQRDHDLSLERIEKAEVSLKKAEQDLENYSNILKKLKIPVFESNL